MTKRTIADLFASYRKHVIPPGAPDIQVTECRAAFYAGAGSMLETLLHVIGDDSVDEDAGVKILEDLRREVEAFAAAGGGDPNPPPADVAYAVDDPHMRDILRDLGEIIRGGLPAGMGFVLFLFQYGEGGALFYLSSADRADVLRVLEEFKRRQVQ